MKNLENVAMTHLDLVVTKTDMQGEYRVDNLQIN